MGRIWCDWERGHFEEVDFKPFENTQRLEHVGRPIRHTSDGLAINERGPIPDVATPDGFDYGYGPSAAPPPRE